jgi:TetR/AcrR family transcriptional regulator, lmrAB and yxaGH operons repressor
MSDRRPAAKEDSSSRESFIHTTGKLLRRQGYAATGLNEIVSRSGAPKGSLYFHFPGGKEELAIAAMERTGEQLRAAIASILTAGEDLPSAMAGLVDAMAGGFAASGYRDGCPIATVTLEAASDSDAMRATAAAVFEGWLQVLQERLHAAGFNPTDARRRALLVLSALEGALLLARAQRDLGALVAVREELVELLARSAGASSSR